MIHFYWKTKYFLFKGWKTAELQKHENKLTHFTLLTFCVTVRISDDVFISSFCNIKAWFYFSVSAPVLSFHCYLLNLCIIHKRMNLFAVVLFYYQSGFLVFVSCSRVEVLMCLLPSGVQTASNSWWLCQITLFKRKKWKDLKWIK